MTQSRAATRGQGRGRLALSAVALLSMLAPTTADLGAGGGLTRSGFRETDMFEPSSPWGASGSTGAPERAADARGTFEPLLLSSSSSPSSSSPLPQPSGLRAGVHYHTAPDLRALSSPPSVPRRLGAPGSLRGKAAACDRERDVVCFAQWLSLFDPEVVRQQLARTPTEAGMAAWVETHVPWNQRVLDSKTRPPGGRLILAFVDHSYATVATNWAARMWSLGLMNWGLVAISRQAFDLYRSLGLPVVCEPLICPAAAGSGSRFEFDTSDKFGKGDLWRYRTHVLLRLMRNLDEGQGIILSDVDAIWIQDIQPFWFLTKHDPPPPRTLERNTPTTLPSWLLTRPPAWAPGRPIAAHWMRAVRFRADDGQIALVGLGIAPADVVQDRIRGADIVASAGNLPASVKWPHTACFGLLMIRNSERTRNVFMHMLGTWWERRRGNNPRAYFDDQIALNEVLKRIYQTRWTWTIFPNAERKRGLPAWGAGVAPQLAVAALSSPLPKITLEEVFRVMNRSNPSPPSRLARSTSSLSPARDGSEDASAGGERLVLDSSKQPQSPSSESPTLAASRVGSRKLLESAPGVASQEGVPSGAVPATPIVIYEPAHVLRSNEETPAVPTMALGKIVLRPGHAMVPVDVVLIPHEVVERYCIPPGEEARPNLGRRYHVARGEAGRASLATFVRHCLTPKNGQKKEDTFRQLGLWFLSESEMAWIRSVNATVTMGPADAGPSKGVGSGSKDLAKDDDYVEDDGFVDGEDKDSPAVGGVGAERTPAGIDDDR